MIITVRVDSLNFTSRIGISQPNTHWHLDLAGHKNNTFSHLKKKKTLKNPITIWELVNFRFEQTYRGGVVPEEQNCVKEVVLSYEPLKNSCILKEWYQIIMSIPVYYDTLQKLSTAIGFFS